MMEVEEIKSFKAIEFFKEAKKKCKNYIEKMDFEDIKVLDMIFKEVESKVSEIDKSLEKINENLDLICKNKGKDKIIEIFSKYGIEKNNFNTTDDFLEKIKERYNIEITEVTKNIIEIKVDDVMLRKYDLSDFCHKWLEENSNNYNDSCYDLLLKNKVLKEENKSLKKELDEIKLVESIGSNVWNYFHA